MEFNELNQSLLSDVSSLDLETAGAENFNLENTNDTAKSTVNTENLLVSSLQQQPPGKKPKNVSQGNPAFTALSGVPNYESNDQFYQNAKNTLRQNPLYESGYGTPKWTPTKIVEKYDDQDYGYLYGMDNEDIYGKLESPWATGFKAVPRLAMGIINKLGMGAGFLYGLATVPFKGLSGENDAIGWDIVGTAADNGLFKAFESLEEETKNEWFPTFQEAADRNKGFWSRVATDADFWADDFVDGLAFLASAWIPGALLAELGVGASIAGRIGSLASKAGTAAEGVAQAGNVAKWFSQSAKMARNIDAFNAWALATSSEAMFEANEVRNTILNSPLYDEYGNPIVNKKTGLPMTLEERKKAAASASLNTFGMNAAILGISNVFELKLLKKMMGFAAPAEGAAGRIIGGEMLGQETAVKAATPLWQTAAKQTAFGVGREGFFEENMQLAIQRYNTKYGLEGTVGNLFNANTWLNVGKQYSKQTVDALFGDDKEAAMNIGLGGVIGSIFGTYSSRKQENKQQGTAETISAAFNNAQNSFVKFGNVFQTEIVDSTDKDGNPIKVQRTVFDQNGNPIYDYDKIFAVSGLALTNANQLDDSVKELGKDKQNLLRTRAWAEFVTAHANAGLEGRISEKLDMLEKADPEALAKLGFVRDQNFLNEIQKLRRIADRIIQQDKQITDSVLLRNRSFFASRNVLDNNRRAHLSEISSRQIVNEEIANDVKRDLDALKSKLIVDASSDLSDGLVDQLNDLQYRIKSQEKTIEALKQNGRDKILPIQVYENVLNNLKQKYNDLLKDNELSMKDLKQNNDGTYAYKKEGRNDPYLNIQLSIKSQTIGELQNEILNDNQLFGLFSDPKTGRENYKKFFQALVSANEAKAKEQVEKEQKKKAEEAAKEKLKKETEHVVVAEPDGTFSIVSPDGTVVLEDIENEEDAKAKAAELTTSLISKKEAEQKKKEEEAKKKPKERPPVKSKKEEVDIEELKAKLDEKVAEANALLTKGVNENAEKRKQFIDDGIAEDEVDAFLEAQWLGTPDGKKYKNLLNEIDQLEVLIDQAKEDEEIPTLDDYLREIFDIYSESPDFKFDYDEWYDSGRANSVIQDYNKKYNKSEPLVGKKGSPGNREATAQEEIDNLDIKDTKFSPAALKAVMGTISKIYQKIRNNEDLLNKLRDKVNEMTDDMLRGSLTKFLETKTNESQFVPLSSVGVIVPVEEHFVYDRINMTAQERDLGFTLLGDKKIIEALSGVDGDLTHLIKAVATIEYVNEAQAMLEQANIPNRSLITYETPKDIANLNRGLSVIAKYRPNDGFNLQLFLKDGTKANIYVGGINRYAIVNPDNTTEKIEWTESQRQFVINNMLVDGRRMTNKQYDQFAEQYRKMQAFEKKVMSFLNDNIENSADGQSIDITPLFKDTFTFSNSSNFFTEKGESFENIIQRAAEADKLFTVLVMDEAGDVTEKQLPVFARYEKTRWRYEFLLNDGEVLVKRDEDGEIVPVVGVKEYLTDDLGLKLEMNENFPGGYAWIAKDNNEAGYKPYKLARTKGTERPELFREFASAFRELKQAIVDGSEKNVFKYRGKEYPTINKLMLAFNIEHYGFYQYKGYVLNFSYNKNAKQDGKVVGKFLIEIRPLDKEQRALVDNDKTVKKALNMYISDDIFNRVTDDLSDEKTTELYKTWLEDLMREFSKRRNSLRNSQNSFLNKIGNELDEHLMFSYDVRNNVNTYKLQLIKKSEDYRSLPFFQFDATSIKMRNSLKLTFNDSAPIASDQSSKKSTKPVEPEVVGQKYVIAEDKKLGFTIVKEDRSDYWYGVDGKAFWTKDRTEIEQKLKEANEGAKPTATAPTNTGVTKRTVIEEIDSNDDEGAFILAETEEDYKRYTEESFNEEVKWLASALPADIKLQDLGTIIKNLLTQKQVLGYYKDKAIYVDKMLSAVGSIYHEAFHALFRDVFTQGERNFYLLKIKDKVGYITNKEVEQFRNDREYFNKTDEEIRDLIYEEHLAEGLRKWKLEKKEPKESWFKQFIKKFGRILDFFKSKKSEIEQLYEDFDAGRYSSRQTQASTIAKEGVYSIAFGRPRLFIKEGAQGFSSDNTVPLNIALQNELIYKLVNKMAGIQGNDTEKFTRAVQEVKKDYDIEKLIKDSDDPKNMADAIRARYENLFNDALFVLGESVPYTLDDELLDADDAKELRTPPGKNIKTLDIIRKEVETKNEALGIERGFDVENLEIPESEEDKAEKEKGGEFDTIHMNPLYGLSREFRSLFSTIPYQYKDEQLGVTLNKVADGNMLFNAMIKIAANTPTQKILPSLQKAIDNLKEDNDKTSTQLEAFANFIKDTFGISDLSDENAKPSKNIFLYKQFIDTFFITELTAHQVKLSTFDNKSVAEIFDASINQDVINKKEKIKFFFESSFRRLNTDEDIAAFDEKFNELQEYIKDKVLPSFSNPLVINSRSKELAKLVNGLKKRLDAVNIILPKSLLRQSFLAIYNIEEKLEFSPQSRQNRIDMELDQRLMKEGAYLQKPFFENLSSLSVENFSNVFADTKDKTMSFGKDRTRIEQINAIAKKAMKYVIKYDVNSEISVFQNAENKKVWRYSKYTPPILLAQIVREYGIEAIIDNYPLLKEWYSDNPLFDGSLENELFLKNFHIGANGGFRQEVDDTAKDGTTFGSIDTRTLMISNIVYFLNRQTISEKMKDSKGKNTDVQITTFLRGRTQEEATTTNFLVTSKYEKLVTKEGNVGQVMIDNLVQMLEQEYNRIQREWSTKDDTTKVRYKGYNNRLHPETKQPIQGDSYVTKKGKVVKLRAYQFHNFKHFFEQQKTSDENGNIRTDIRDLLRDAAKSGMSFEKAVNTIMPGQDIAPGEEGLSILNFLNFQFSEYMDETFEVYKKGLIENQIITKTVSAEGVETISSDFIPETIQVDYGQAENIQEYGYSGLVDVLKDHHYNVFLNKLLANQIFDGDIATGLAGAKEFYKRNKAGVISGNSTKSDNYLRTATIENLEADVNMDDLTQYAKEVTDDTLDDNRKDIADGQSWHVLNHRIRMMDSWGRIDARSRQLLNEYKFRNLTVDEIKELENKKIVLNSIKTATGGVFEYFKLSEHLISRVDVSYLVPKEGQSVKEAYASLDMLYAEIERLEDKIVRNPYVDNASEIEDEIEKLYREVHQYWKPKRTRAKLHYLLNSMELSGIDQVFDPNASKKTTIIPVKLNETGETELRPAKQITDGIFKFLQVETSGIHDHITLPTQARQLLTTYINKLDTKAYNNKTLAQLSEEYAQNLGETTRARAKLLDAKIIDKDGNFNIVQLYNTMYSQLEKQGADSNTLKFLEVKDGVPVFNPNMPAIKKIFTYYYFSMFNDAVFSETVSGRSDILVSSYGYEILYDSETGRIITEAEQNENRDAYNSDRYKTRPLGVSIEEKNGMKVYTIEVIIPEPLTKNESLKALYLEKLNEFFSTRIPTEDKRSMVVSKVVDYIDMAYRNSIIVPQVVHILSGSDLDVDKLFSHTFAHYIDFNDEAHVYGDYSKYATPSQGKFVEYINYMLNEDMAVKDALKAELDNVEKRTVFTSDFIKLKDQLGLSDMTYTAEEISEKRKEIRNIVDVISNEAKDLQTETNMLFDLHIQNNERRGSEGRQKWIDSLERYRNMNDLLDLKKAELDAIKEEQKRIDNTLKLAALYNVLKRMGLPTTQSGLTKYTSEFGNPTIAVLQNKNLQLKIDILSNEEVFKNWYIKEISDTSAFSEIAESIGSSVDDVVDQNSIHSIMGDVVSNNLNSSSKDGIGISASFNKFLAFAEKNELTIDGVLFGTMKIDSNVTEFGTIIEKTDIESIEDYSDFSNTQGIRNIGKTLGMFADAVKDPIPSVLNLNPGTASVSNLLTSMSGNLQLGLLINKIPFIQEITQSVELAKSNAQSKSTRGSKNTSQIIKYEILKPTIEKLYFEDRAFELFKKDDEGNLTNEIREMYIQTIDPNPELSNKIDNNEVIELRDVGFVVRYQDGTEVAEDVSKYYFGKVYTDALYVNNDIIKLVGILNLIKEQKPDFAKLDSMLEHVNYFMSGESVFGSSIVKVLSSSAEYQPLITAAKKMSEYSKQIFIERSPLFKALNSILLRNFPGAFGNPKASQNITDQIVKYLIIQKTKVDLTEKLEKVSKETDKDSVKLTELYENTLKYFTADYWIDDNTILEDLDYLYDNNPGNPFVEFLKTSLRGNVLLLEGSTRIRLDKDIAENINNGYEALQKSLDRKTSILARQLYYYLLIKDGLGYSNNSFLGYINPELKQYKETSTYLDDFQDLLKAQDKFINQKNNEIAKIVQNTTLKDDQKNNAINKIANEVYQNYLKLFDKYFNNENKGKVDWINIILKKILANSNNQKYIYNYYGTRKIENDKDFSFIKEVVSLNLFPDLINDPKFIRKNEAFNFADYIPEDSTRFTIDFNGIKNRKTLADFEIPFDEMFGNLISMQLNPISKEYKFSTFPMIIKTKNNRLFKLVAVDNKSLSESIALQSITGNPPETRGVSGMYVEIKLEGTKNILNLGFSEEDGQRIYNQSLIGNRSYQSEDDYLYNTYGIDITDPNYQGSDQLPAPTSPGTYEIEYTNNQEDFDYDVANIPDWLKQQVEKDKEKRKTLSKSELDSIPQWLKDQAGISDTKTPTQTSKANVEITKSNYSREKVQNDGNTAYVFTENNYSITAFPDQPGGGSAIIRGLDNAFAIVTKKTYNYNTGENINYSNTAEDFKEFVEVNTKLINELKNSGKSKIVFPKGFATDKAKMPTKFAEWLQKALLDNFGLITELNSTKTGLISKSVTAVKTVPLVEAGPVSLKQFFTLEKAQSQKAFRKKPLVFVNKIYNTQKDGVIIAMSNNGKTISIDAEAMKQKFKEKAWTKPSKQKDGSTAAPIGKDEFKTFDEFFTFALIHEIKHDTIKKQEKETVGQYEDRINQAALEDLRKNYTKEGVSKPEVLEPIDEAEEGVIEMEDETTEENAPDWLKKQIEDYKKQGPPKPPKNPDFEGGDKPNSCGT